MIFISRSEKETQKFGQKLAQSLKGGEVIGLIGDLGGGKTTFVKGLAKGLGIKELITSPTFLILKDYGKLVHVDLYRLENPKEIETIGLLDYFKNKDKIIVIEWAEKIRNVLKKLPAKIIWVKFEYVNESTRKIKITNVQAPITNQILSTKFQKV